MEDVLVDVPVPTNLHFKLKEAAAQRHETHDAFVLCPMREVTGMP